MREYLPAPIVFIGQFPPPLTGYSLATARLAERISQRQPLDVVNIAGVGSKGRFTFHLSRIARVAKALARIFYIRVGRGGWLAYTSCDGGLGVLYVLLIAAVVRACGMRLYVHHHSYGYIDRTRQLMRALLAVAGSRATHIVLSAGMAKALAERYGRPINSLVLSNAALIPTEPWKPRERMPDAPLILGMLSNLTTEKGLFIYLDLLKALRKAGLPCLGLLAGPLANEQDRPRFDAMREQLADSLRWLGPVQGAAKKAFFAEIDLFIFPTLYVYEAQPLVIFEALERGVPVIAYDRGTIGEQIRDAGLMVRRDADFVSTAESFINGLSTDLLGELTHKARTRFNEEKDTFSSIVDFF
ncbi:glycosyltransferase family 4 protein [Methylosinus sp. LW3]|uniref:glycosyltransferase family 4 protein n=1 Tax=Methylosinus sp. LW3 TaxID=107635 RepID=UPI000465BECC|nr:glycosyltransferase family 4 protein [Methylosinus sp. LW3]